MGIDHYPRETTEYVPVPVTGDTDLDVLPVAGQVQPYGARPDPGAWEPAVWGVDSAGNTVAKILIGPGTPFDFSEAPGTKIPWVKVTTPPPQLPWLEGDPIQIT